MCAKYTCRRYVVDWSTTSPTRKRVDEHWLLQLMTSATQRLRAGLPREVIQQLTVRDLAEQMQLMTASNPASATASAAAAELPGRQSGSAAWRSARGETGKGCNHMVLCCGWLWLRVCLLRC